jgi:hypothetical protein
LCGFSPPHFGPPQTYGLLYGRAKTSYTAETLCAIGAKIFVELSQKYIDKTKEFAYNELFHCLIGKKFEGDEDEQK